MVQTLLTTYTIIGDNSASCPLIFQTLYFRVEYQICGLKIKDIFEIQMLFYFITV